MFPTSLHGALPRQTEVMRQILIAVGILSLLLAGSTLGVITAAIVLIGHVSHRGRTAPTERAG